MVHSGQEPIGPCHSQVEAGDRSRRRSIEGHRSLHGRLPLEIDAAPDDDESFTGLGQDAADLSS